MKRWPGIWVFLVLLLNVPIWAQGKNEVAVYALANFNPAYFAVQSGVEFAGDTTPGIGWGADYSRTLSKHNAVGILYGQNSSEAQLFQGTQFLPCCNGATWPLQRYEVSIQAVQQFERGRWGAFIFEGPGTIVTNGGANESGWTANFAVISGFGFDVRLTRRLFARSRVSFEDSNTGCYYDRACNQATWSVAQDLWSGIAFKW